MLNYKFTVDTISVKECVANLDRIISKLNKNKLNQQRAESFRTFAQDMVKANKLGLDPISEATIKLSGSDHPPISLTDALINSMVIKKRQNTDIDVGYFGSAGQAKKRSSGEIQKARKEKEERKAKRGGETSSKKTSIRPMRTKVIAGKHAGSKLKMNQIAILHHLGYRIPLTGTKGAKVRRFLAANGIFPSATKEFLEVKPRPFLQKAIDHPDQEKLDNAIIEKFLKELDKK